jgi:glycosyltransferase involved in cell wall biosynthesis
MLVSKAAHSDGRVLAEARLLEGAEVEVTILAWDREKRFPRESRLGTIRVLDLGSRASHGAGATQAVQYLVFWVRCFAYLLRHRWGVVHCHDFDTLPPGWLAARILRRRVIFDGHEPYGEAFARTLPRPVAGFILWLERRLVPRIDYLISPSESCAAYYVKRDAPRRVIFANYKDPGEFDVAPEELARLRRELGLEGRMVLVHAGLLDTHVSLDRIVAAVQGLEGIDFLVAGSGRLSSWMEEQSRLHPNVHYLGLLPAEKAQQMIALSDCVNCLVRVAPEIGVYGTASNKLFDALAAGRAVLCSRTSPEIAQVTEAYDCGIVLEESFGVAEIRQSLTLLRDDPERKARFGRNARRACTEKYNRGAAAGGLFAAYRYCLPESAPAEDKAGGGAESAGGAERTGVRGRVWPIVRSKGA